MQPSDKPSQKRPDWQYLIAPMLVLSVGLHGALLLLPTGASDDDLVPPPDPEEDGIAITRIDPPNAQVATNVNSSAQATPASQRSSTSGSPSSRQNTSNTSSRSSRENSSASASGSRGSRSTAASQASTPPRGSRGSDNTSRTSSTSRNSSGSENSSNSRQDNSTASQIAASNPLVTFLDYFAVFETYGGSVPVEDEEIQELKEIWLSGLKEDEVQLAGLEAEDIEPLAGLEKIPYPAGICLPETPTTAQLLVLVDSEGAPNRDIFLVKDTGYTSFDDQAESVIRNHEYPKQDNPVAYLVDVDVAYDPGNCQWPPPSVEGVSNDFWELLDSYIGPALTRPKDTRAAEERWRSQRSLPETTPLPDFEATISYDLALCLPIAPGPAQFGVVVEPDGTFRGEPQLLRSTGYRRFNNQAQELLNLFTFSSGNTPQVHVLTVSVDYNPLLCESLSAQAP